MPRAPIWSLPFRTAGAFRRTSSARTLPTTIPCSSSPTSRGIQWAASAARSNSYGKAYIHGAGEPEKIWTADHDSFLDAMADAALSVAEYFKDKTVFINVMKNMSVDCDCCAVAEDPCMADIGILASLDPIAVDQACLDLVYASDDPGRDHLVERIESLNGVRTVESAAALGFGTREYELVEL